MSTIVETFESSGNSRAVGTVNGRDLTAMKKQLIDMEKSIAQCARDLAGKRDPIPAVKAEAEVSKIYPRLEPTTPKQLPTPPVGAPIMGENATTPIGQSPMPDGAVEDIGNVIKMISSIMAQMMSVFKSIQPVATAIDGAPQESVPLSSPRREAPTFSRSLPGTPPAAPKEDKKKKKAAAKDAKSPALSPMLAPIAANGSEVHTTVLPFSTDERSPRKALPTVPACCDARAECPPSSPRKAEDVVKKSTGAPPTEEAVSAARANLDLMIKKNYEAQPSEFVVMSEDELYCIRRFRQMIVDRQGEMTKNFIHRFDKLCEKK